MTTLRKLSIVLVATCASASLAAQEPGIGGEDILADAAAGTAISVGDVIDIRVARRADLSLRFTVPPGGEVVYPLIGKVRVAGLRPEQLASDINRLFRKGQHLTNPDVTVLVSSFAPRRVYVLGAVKSSQAVEVPLDGHFTLTQAIAVTGGFLDGADTRDVRLLRRSRAGDGKPLSTKVIQINVDAITEQNRTEFDVTLIPGDTIIVARRDDVFVLGQVKSPGSYSLGRGKWTLTRAIAKAGGFTEYARSTRVKVISRSNGSAKAEDKSARTVDVREIINTGKLSKDVELRPGDVVFVPESIF